MDEVWLKRLGALLVGLVIAGVLVFFIFPPKVQVPPPPALGPPEPLPLPKEKAPVVQSIDLSKAGQGDVILAFDRESAIPVLEVANSTAEAHTVEVRQYLHRDSALYLAALLQPGETKKLDVSAAMAENNAVDFVCVDCSDNPVAGKLVFLVPGAEWAHIVFDESRVLWTRSLGEKPSNISSTISFPASKDGMAMYVLSNASDNSLPFELEQIKGLEVPAHYSLVLKTGLSKAKTFSFSCSACSFEPLVFEIK